MAELTEEQKRVLQSVQPNMQTGQGASKLSTQQLAAILSVSPQQTRGQQFQQSIAANPVTSALFSIPGTRPLMEFGNATARNVTQGVDFITEGLNYALRPTGANIPSLQRSLENVGALAPPAGYMQPGLGQEIVSGIGEALPAVVGGQGLVREAYRRTASLVPQIASTGRRVAGSLASTTPTQEAISATGAVIGSELGQEAGLPGAGFVGALVGGFGATPIINGIERAFTNLTDFNNMAKSLTSVRTDIAGEMLATSLRSAGMSPREAIEQYRMLGPNALPADIDQAFREVLRAAMNIDSGISGAARTSVNQRQQQAGQRISDSLDIINAGNADEYLTNLDATLGPQITALYQQAAQQPLALSGRLRTLLEGDTSLGKAFEQAQGRVLDRVALGETAGTFDYIDETKKVLDDQIKKLMREGQGNAASILIRFKNQMVAEADNLIPDYADARKLYAGKKAVEDAADFGREIFKTDSREVSRLADALTTQMTAQERTAYVLGAKDAIIKRIDSTGMNRNQVMALFGKNGDAAKLATLFDTPEQGEQFLNALKRETEFAITRNAVVGNSSTVAQASQLSGLVGPTGIRKSINQAIQMVFGSPAQLSGEVAGIIDNMNQGRNTELYKSALIRAGDLLLASGMDVARLEALLRNGSIRVLKKELQKIAAPTLSGRSAAMAGITAQQATDSQE
tara:strand:+ start:1625 stop:3685 length:2061 start_codon:yes stop_codon:yes gene_type:complete